MEYARDNDVIVKMMITSEGAFFEEDSNEKVLDFEPYGEDIYIHPDCMYYRAVSEDVTSWVESDAFTLQDLKPVKEWAFELDFEN